MIRTFTALAVATLAISMLMTAPGQSAPKKKPVCYEQGCTGDRCIICTR